jgi:hypothetical protein
MGHINKGVFFKKNKNKIHYWPIESSVLYAGQCYLVWGPNCPCTNSEVGVTVHNYTCVRVYEIVVVSVTRTRPLKAD